MTTQVCMLLFLAIQPILALKLQANEEDDYVYGPEHKPNSVYNIKVYDYGWTSWTSSKAECEAKGERLCRWSEVCPDGAGSTPLTGTSTKDIYIPIECASENTCQTGCQKEILQIGKGLAYLAELNPAAHGWRVVQTPCGRYWQEWQVSSTGYEGCHRVGSHWAQDSDIEGHTPYLTCCTDSGAYDGGGGGSGGGSAGGDPHLLNLQGERFNINRLGKAPLVSITSDGAAHLEVVALIEGVKKCQKKMFITQVNASGSWLEKNVAVQVGQNNKDNRAFTVVIDGKEVWSPQAAGYQPPTDAKTVFSHADKFSMDELSARVTHAKVPGLELTTAHDVKLKIMRPLHRPNAPPHLNFNIQGLKKIPLSLKVGGLLGQDDHSYWSTRDENCPINFARTETTEGSVASAY